MELSPLFLIVWMAVLAEGRLGFWGQQTMLHLNNNKNSTPPSMCGRIHPENLPQECLCRDKPPYGLIVDCIKVFNSTYFNDTIGMEINVDPCNPDGSRVSVDVTERNHNIDYPIAGVTAGEQQEFPIPGVSIVVPGVGHMGVDVAILITGNPDQLTLKIGLDACLVLATRSICASHVPGLSSVLPWWVLSGTYHFSDICEQLMQEEGKKKQGDLLILAASEE